MNKNVCNSIWPTYYNPYQIDRRKNHIFFLSDQSIVITFYQSRRKIYFSLNNHGFWHFGRLIHNGWLPESHTDLNQINPFFFICTLSCFSTLSADWRTQTKHKHNTLCFSFFLIWCIVIKILLSLFSFSSL